METEPIAPNFQNNMPFNPFSQHFNQQEHQHLMMLQQQQQLAQQNQQVDEEMEMADDTSDMKYSENDMNQMNITMGSVNQTNLNLQKAHEEQLLQQLHNQQLQNQQQQLNQFNQQQQQQKFGRLISDEQKDLIKKEKYLEDEESYDEEDYDDEEDDLDDYDEHLVHEMMLGAAPEVQNIIKLIVSGFSTCATETLRYLVEEENLAVNSPCVVGLIDHLKTQETMLIVNCLRTQQYQQQLIKQHQQQILASQLMGKQIDPKTIDPKLLNQLNVPVPNATQPTPNNIQQANLPQLKAQQQQPKKSSSSTQRLQQQQQQQLNQANQLNAQKPISQLPNNNLRTNQSTGALSPPNTNGPLTSSPINKPFDQLNSINVNHLSNFNNTLHNAFTQSHHHRLNSQNNSAQNSQSNSPIHTPPLHSQTTTANSFNRPNQTTQQPNPFSTSTQFNNFPNNNQQTFFDQTGVLSSFKPPFNDSGFSEQ